MLLLVAIITALVLTYLVVNRKRNVDPLNRKCAAEICTLIDNGNPTAIDIAGIFMSNARYRKQANHVLSMVPPLLMNAGYTREQAMSVAPLLWQAAAMVPK